jgi:Dolichyl-phosphate-mannose-protein mannosyltransferase
VIASVHVEQRNRAKQTLSHYVCYGLVLFSILTFAFIRYRLRAVPLERDEGEYAYAGQLILQGIPPYKLAYSMKLPGTAAAYALILAALGQTPSAVHVGLIFVNAATSLLVFFLGSRLFGFLAGAVACASYALLSANPSGLGLAGHASHFVVLPALAGILMLLGALESNKTWQFFGSGLVLGLAFVMKQPGVLFLLFGGVYLLQARLRSLDRWRGLAPSLGAFALGGVLPFAVTCLLMLTTGVFQKFWFWTFSYTSQYASRVPLDVGFALFKFIIPHVVGPVFLIWLIAGAGLTTFLWCSNARSHGVFVGLFLLFSILAVCPGLYFREHYFILMLPAVSLLAGLAVSCATDKLSAWKSSLALSAAPMLLFLAAFAYTIYGQREVFFQMTPLEVCRSIYGANPFPEALDVARLVRSQTPKGTLFAIVGSEPEIFFYADRPSATGYIYTYELMEPQKYAAIMQNEMIAEIEKARPELLIYVDVPLSWLPQEDANMYIFDWCRRYVAENYRLLAVDKSSLNPMSSTAKDSTSPPLSTWNIYVYRRKQLAVSN